MTQYIRAPQAFAATTSVVVNAASPPATDLRNLAARMREKLTFGRGTTQPGTVRTNTPTSTGVATRSLLLLDSVSAAAIAAGVDFSDMLYNSSTAEPGSAYAATSETITGSQSYGWCRHVVISFGDSLEDGATGSGAYPDLGVSENQPWSFGCDTPGLPSTIVIPTQALAPPVIFNNRTHERSRVVYKAAKGGWRLANQPSPASYPGGSPWIDNLQQLAKIPIWPWQKLSVYIEPGSNDVDYYSGLFAVPAGTPGYVSAGSPNFFDDALSPFIAAVKAAFPANDVEIIWQTPTVRDSTGAPGSDNAKFVEISSYGIANKAARQINQILDTRQIPQLDCRNPAATADKTYWQNDNTHRTVPGYALLKGYKRAIYDKSLGFVPDPAYASAIL